MRKIFDIFSNFYEFDFKIFDKNVFLMRWNYDIYIRLANDNEYQ